ncbi:MAG: ISAzo13 family transposase, partial [Rhodopila sp.]
MIDQEQIRERFTAVSPQLDERARRLLAATEARAAGYGGIAAVSQATGVAPSTIGRGLQDLAAEPPLAPGRVRRPGGGRKPLAADDPTLRADLLTLVEPDARADPMSPLRWTCKSLRRLA